MSANNLLKPPAAMTEVSRRAAMQRLTALVSLPSTAALLAACGGGSEPMDNPVAPAPPQPSPPPAPPTAPVRTGPLQRLKAALQRGPITVAPTIPNVSQGRQNEAVSSLGIDAIVHPPLINSGMESLATVAPLWGYRRDLWSQANRISISGYPMTPVLNTHEAATIRSGSICGLHFVFEGQAFEILFAGNNPQITLLVDGRYAAPGIIDSAIAGGVIGPTLTAHNTFTRVDFGTAARRQISLYAVSSFGPCAIAIGAQDRLAPWDRSTEPSFAVMCDSYGGAFGPNWGTSGPFWEAAAQLGIVHLDRDAGGGTGYSVNAANADTLNVGNAFLARLPNLTRANPDLFLTAGGINDNNFYPMPPVYVTAGEARSGFETAVMAYYAALRQALPESVLAAMGPWQPRQTTPVDTNARAKADAVLTALRTVGGPWIFLDNLAGSWSNSAGRVSGIATGPWQTGSGNSGAPAGDGNGDLYLSADGVHPNTAGCLYLGTRIATDLRAALLAL